MTLGDEIHALMKFSTITPHLRFVFFIFTVSATKQSMFFLWFRFTLAAEGEL